MVVRYILILLKAQAPTFSEEVVRKAVGGLLRDRRYEFGVRMIPLEQARGSGMVKELRR